MDASASARSTLDNMDGNNPLAKPSYACVTSLARRPYSQSLAHTQLELSFGFCKRGSSSTSSRGIARHVYRTDEWVLSSVSLLSRVWCHPRRVPGDDDDDDDGRRHVGWSAR